MRYIFGFVALIALFFGLGALLKPKKEAEKKKELLNIEKTFPFSETDKIEVISYPVRREWDTVNVDDQTIVLDIVKDKKLQIDTTGIKDRVALNDVAKMKLFNFLFNEDCDEGGSQASCFDPRHSVLFYNKDNEIIAYLEVCFDCSVSRSSEGFEYNWICYERIGNLRKIFKDAGIKYFGENE